MQLWVRIEEKIVRKKRCTQGERAYMRGLSSIWQTDSIVDVATAAVALMEREVISDIEGDDTIEVDIS
jgi:hypothetical protein